MGKREYKDTVFVDLFFHCEEKIKNFASLLRALLIFLKLDFSFGLKDLKPISLSSSLYNGRRTDVLYDVKNTLLVFVEHQSTINPNMPLRFLEYFVEVLKKLPYERSKYGSTPLELKDVLFINLYNGKEKADDLYISYLSDLIKTKVSEDVSIELKVFNININLRHNEKLLELCPVLKDYVLFVDEAERQLSKDREKGLEIAIDNCIRKGILAEYLMENRRGIMGLFLGEYDQNIALEVAREESYDRGVMEGRQEGILEGRQEGRQEGKLEGRLEGRQEGIRSVAKNFLSMGLPIQDVAKATGLSREEIASL